jgi:hypothetical protein
MAMKTFNVNDVLGAADTNEYLVNTKYAVKSADEIRNNTTTLVADGDLSIHLDSNKTYEVHLYLLYHGNTVSNFKFGWGFPAGVSMYGAALGIYVGFGTTWGGYSAFSDSISPGVAQSLQGQDPFSDSAFTFQGTIVTAGTAGNLNVKWSQDTSGGFSTKLLKGSSLILRRVS